MEKTYSIIEELFRSVKRGPKGEDQDLSLLSLSGLAHLCRQATDRYFQGEDYDDRYCLELFRWAIQHQDDQAWDNIIQQYGNLVRAWIQRHHSFAMVDEEQDYFVNRTFDNFWRAFSRDPQKLSKFSNLKALLQYLKLCAYSAVQEYAERQMRPRHISLSDRPVETIAGTVDPVTNVDDRIMANVVWQHVISTVKNNQERIIAEASFLYDMKPREIYSQHMDEFADVSQVSRVKGNFLARLRRDKQLLSIIMNFD